MTHKWKNDYNTVRLKWEAENKNFSQISKPNIKQIPKFKVKKEFQ